MKNNIILGLIVIVVVVGLADYYFGFHTYFQRTEVNEVFPAVSTDENGIGPKIEIQGSFVDVDTIHKGSGTASIIEQQGKRYLRFEDFQVTNGPDLYVYLSESQMPGNDLKSLDKYINLGRLKGNVGDQNYEIPEPFRSYNTAIIWCQKFGVLFSYAIME